MPPERRPVWSAALTAIETEEQTQTVGYREAMLAHLTVLLVDIARLATDVVGDLRRSDEPLLAAVFEAIDERLGTALSARDVAAAVGMTVGHLTTVVRRRTGRTVGEWIADRRMAEARRLLTATDLPIATVAARVGLADPGYFARMFKRANGVTPREWRAG
ncbi:helix-turn-helix transcriptional regulator [Tsukamurella soli]|uniref:helix-turn-helix transcriptional regulator n=1 Tax=Tsukamurella soli TaxID=644556 RepID=UPI00360CD9EE